MDPLGAMAFSAAAWASSNSPSMSRHFQSLIVTVYTYIINAPYPSSTIILSISSLVPIFIFAKADSGTDDIKCAVLPFLSLLSLYSIIGALK